MFQKATKEDKLQKAIDDATESLLIRDPDSDEYAKIVDQLTKLNSMRPKPDRISKETIATISANLVGILIIVGHERAHTMTSKAIGFLQKLR